jgi:hypothetical protein
MLHHVLVHHVPVSVLPHLICTEKVPWNSPVSSVMGLAVFTGTGLLTSEQPLITCTHCIKHGVVNALGQLMMQQPALVDCCCCSPWVPVEPHWYLAQ